MAFCHAIINGMKINGDIKQVEDLFDEDHIEYNLDRARLYEESLHNKEAKLTANGALLVYTGKHTGRAAKDKYIVRDSGTDSLVDWDSNQEIDEEKYFTIRDLNLIQ